MEKPNRWKAALRWLWAKRTIAVPFLFWFFSVVLWEMTLHLIAYGDFSGSAWYVVPFSLIFVLILTLLARLFSEKINRIVTGALTIALFIFYGSQLVYNRVFGTFYSLSMMKLGGDAVTSFWKETLMTIGTNFHWILVLAIPVILFFVLQKCKKMPLPRRRWTGSVVFFLVAVNVWLGVVASLSAGGTGFYTVYDFYHGDNTQTEQSVKCFGIVTTLRLEMQHQWTGGGEEETVIAAAPVVLPPRPTMPVAEEDPIDTSPNVMDIDFDALNAETTDEELLAMNAYFAASEGSHKHEYTGKFEGYNVIEVCAESYAPALLDPERTPTLWRLANEGFVFDQYYTSYPNTTINAEYSLCMGLFPDLSRSKYDASFQYSAKNSVPFCLGNALRNEGYRTFAFHNYEGWYFDRDKSHPNMGYTCYFAKDGMSFTTAWPASDLEMMEQALPYIFDETAEEQEPFHAYFMTFSGHYRYDYSTNLMCVRNRDVVRDSGYSTAVEAYLSCNMELEYAMQYLMEQLEEHDMLDHTLIVLTGDHYPYGLLEYQYAELLGHDLQDHFEKYHNSFICWAADMEEPIVCSEPCCNVDILPTVLNLLGVEYDSRLLMGTDVLSDSPHVAILTDESFLTDQLMFDASANEITYLVDESEVPEGYFDSMVQLVKNKLSLSCKILYNDYFDYVFPDSVEPEE